MSFLCIVLNECSLCSWLPIVRRLVLFDDGRHGRKIFCLSRKLTGAAQKKVEQFSHALVGKHDALAVVVTVEAPALADNRACFVPFHFYLLPAHCTNSFTTSNSVRSASMLPVSSCSAASIAR